MRNYRKWLRTVKENKRAKFPYLINFYKSVRIRELLVDFELDNRVKGLLKELSVSITPKKLDLSNLTLREIYELKRLGKIPYSEYLKAEIRELEKIKSEAEKLLTPKIPKITVLPKINPNSQITYDVNDNLDLKVLNYPIKQELNDFSDNIALHTKNNPIERKKKQKKKKITKTQLLKQEGYTKETYLCSKCNRFHKYLFQGKLSNTHLTHFKYFVEYKWKIPNTELFKMEFKKKWRKLKSHIA